MTEVYVTLENDGGPVQWITGVYATLEGAQASVDHVEGASWSAESPDRWQYGKVEPGGRWFDNVVDVERWEIQP